MDLLFKNICMQSIWIHSLILWYPLSKNIGQNVMYLMTECTLKNKDYKKSLSEHFNICFLIILVILIIFCAMKRFLGY